MSDARALLRQQRAARRIDHPHVQYTAPGKLSCTVCHEPIKSEALWENHTRTAAHRQRLLAAEAAAEPSTKTKSAPEHPTSEPKSSTDTPSDADLIARITGGAHGATGHKRKHAAEDDDDTDNDTAMDDAAHHPDDQDNSTNPARTTKRTKAEPGPSLHTATNGSSSSAADSQSPSDHRNKENATTTNRERGHSGSGTGTPPAGLVRRISSSGTPSHGIEIQIPSRPATPSASAASTPKATPIGRSAMIPHDLAGLAGAIKLQPPPRAAFAGGAAGGSDSAPAPTSDSNHNNHNTASADGEEDDDWAAFENEVVRAPVPTLSAIPAAARYAGDAVIAAAPMTAEQIVAKKEEEAAANEKRRAKVDVDLEDEKEEAKRALENEFEEMEELEARVRKLKEKREEIRRGSVPVLGGVPAASNGTGEPLKKVGEEPADSTAQANGEEQDEDEDEDEDDDDDWAGFRFRA